MFHKVKVYTHYRCSDFNMSPMRRGCIYTNSESCSPAIGSVGTDCNSMSQQSLTVFVLLAAPQPCPLVAGAYIPWILCMCLFDSHAPRSLSGSSTVYKVRVAMFSAGCRFAMDKMLNFKWLCLPSAWCLYTDCTCHGNSRGCSFCVVSIMCVGYHFSPVATAQRHSGNWILHLDIVKWFFLHL